MNLNGIIKYRVKPLQWQECKSLCTAETPFGVVKTIRAAKELAEEWYLSRLLPALEECE